MWQLCLSYLVGWVTGLIFLVIEPYKNDKFVRFNAFQSIFLSIAVFAVWIGAMILSTILGFITHGLGFFIMGPLMMLVWLGVVVAVVICMIKAYGQPDVQAADHWRHGRKAGRFVERLPGR